MLLSIDGFAAKALGDKTVREVTQVKKRVLSAAARAKDFKSNEGAVGKIQGAGEESYEGLAKPRRPHHHLATCTDATLRPPHGHRRTICRISRSERSQDNRTACRWATLPDTSAPRLRSSLVP